MKTKLILLLLILVAPALMSLAQNADQPATPPAGTVTTATNAPAGEEVAEVLSFDDLPLPDAVRQLARLADLNIEFDPRLLNVVDAQGRPVPPVTVKEKWKNVTAMQALQALLDNNGWQIERQPNNPIVRIVAKDPKALDPLLTVVVQLNYSDPTNIMAEVKPTLSDRSSIYADLRTHQLILRTTEKELIPAQKLIAQLDSATRQVLIEAKIIETTKDITSAKGIDWTGTLANQHVSFGNGLTSGTVASGVSTVPSTSTTATSPGGRPLSGSAISSVVSNSTSFITSIAGNPSSAGGFSANTATGISPTTAFLNADGVSAVLSFLNTDADTKSISFPRTVSLDGVSNELMVVQNIPIFEQTQGSPIAGQQQGLATVLPNYQKTVDGVVLNEVGIKLAVTPRIAGPSNVLITLQPEISKVDALVASDTLGGQVNTSPIFDRRRIITSASVPSGYTLVLGGLDQDVTDKTYTKVPFFGDLPGLGYIFGSNSKTHTRDTIIIFVTPTIIQDADFQPTPTEFFKSKNENISSAKDSPWDSGEPRDWTKPKPTVEPVYQP